MEDLKKLLECESVLSEPTVGAPFGVGCRKALDTFMDLAKGYGLETKIYDGYCGYVEYGDGTDMFGILCHLDVVPAGSGWSYPPYTLSIDSGNLYGRGVVDNKGPAIIALQILNELKKTGYVPNHRIRIIVGCNEESGSACLKHYRRVAELPKFNIVLDSDFPVINSEKGIAHLKLTVPDDSTFKDNIISLNCGTRPNIVPDLCVAELKLSGTFAVQLVMLASKYGQHSNVFNSPEMATQILQAGYNPTDFSATFFADKIIVTTYGISCHAMCPDKGENAFWKMIMLFKALSGSLKTPTLDCLKDYVCSSMAAERLRIDACDDKSGALTFNVGVANYINDKLTITLDFRLPLCINLNEVQTKILDKFPPETHIEIEHFSDNLYVDKNTPLIKKLLKVYGDYTGQTAQCVKSGGGTYARELPNSVAFGPTFPNTETDIHNADEHISVVQYNQLKEIYHAAILELDKI